MAAAGEAAGKPGAKGKKEAGSLPAVRLPVAHVLSRELQAYHDHVCSVLGFRSGAAASAGAAASTAGGMAAVAQLRGSAACSMCGVQQQDVPALQGLADQDLPCSIKGLP